MKTLVSIGMYLLAAPLLAAPQATENDAIQWLHAADNAIPRSGANDSRPTILYFTFDT